jgi:hypothetical protein
LMQFSLPAHQRPHAFDDLLINLFPVTHREKESASSHLERRRHARASF